jgi:hypothetical protein
MVDLIQPNNVSRVDDLLSFQVQHPVNIMGMVYRIAHEHARSSSVTQLTLSVTFSRDNTNFTKKTLSFQVA